MIPVKEIGRSKKILVAAHRGSSGTAPENTLAAFREAVDAGANFVEADVQVTLDGKFIAFHDKNLSRTTDVRGKVGDLKYEQFSNADAGSWFNKKFKNEHVPLLSDLIKIIKGKSYLNIELKNISGDGLGDNIERVIEIIHDEEFEDYAVFSSFYYDTLYRLKKKYPKFPVAAIRIPRDKRLPSEILSIIGADGFIAQDSEFTQEVIDDIVRNNIFSAVYLINTEEEFKRAMKLPVRVLVTNFPARIINFLNR